MPETYEIHVGEVLDEKWAVYFAPFVVTTSADQTLLTVADTRSRWVWSFQVQPDGSLAHGQPFYRLETTDDRLYSGADGMTSCDSEIIAPGSSFDIFANCSYPGIDLRRSWAARPTGRARSPSSDPALPEARRARSPSTRPGPTEGN